MVSWQSKHFCRDQLEPRGAKKKRGKNWSMGCGRDLVFLEMSEGRITGHEFIRTIHHQRKGVKNVLRSL